MRYDTSTFGSDAKAFIEDLIAASKPAQIVDVIERYIATRKFTYFLFSKVPFPDEQLSDVVLGMRWPKEFLKVYCEQRYERDDPMFHRCRTSMFPFIWSESTIGLETDKRGRELLRLAREHGMVKGYAMPIHGPRGFLACVCMSGVEPETDRQTRLFLHLVAYYGFKRLLRVNNPHAFHSPLTHREGEVLKLVALGKSAREIGSILSITKRTADEYASNAVRKLGAANRTHAVAIAIRDKIIAL